MSKTIYIGGRLESKEKGNVVTGANAILDDTKGKKQNVINKEIDDELLRLEQSKQDNLNFDNAPTENSTNPVTSGGVYMAEKALSDAIEAILLLIPSAATALNKLVDTNTMNSSISTATATFRGTYNAVSDLGLTYQATHAQIEAALDALGLTADNNDYAFVQVPVSDQSQDIAKTERYKNNGTNWQYEYDLNTSGFTAAQWGAINSTITLALVQKLAALPTNAELLQALGLKQDVLTFDNAPTTDSNNPVKSGGIKNAIDTAAGDEATARENADLALAGLIGDEKTRAEGIEGGLNNRLGAVEGSVTTIQGVIPSGATSSNKLVDNNSMTTYIGTIIDNIDATFNVTSTDGHVTLAITQVNGVITSVQLATSDIASAADLNLKASQADLTTLAGRVTTAEGNITSLTGRMTTAEGDIDQLLALYNALQQSAPQVIQPTDTWPVANPSTTVIYRVIDRVNTPPEYYSDYMWNGTAFVLMATYNNAIDDVPTAGSNNLVESGGVEMEIQAERLKNRNELSFVTSGIPWYLTNGTPQTGDSRSRTYLIPVKAGDKIRTNMSAGSTVFSIAAFNNNKQLVIESSVSDVVSFEYIYEVPSGIAYLQFCYYNEDVPEGYYYVEYIGGLDTKIEGYKTDLICEIGDIGNEQFKVLGFCNNSGAFEYNVNFKHTRFLLLGRANKIKAHVSMSGSGAAIAFFSDNNNESFISSVQGKGDTGDGIYDFNNIDVPATAKYVVFSTHINYLSVSFATVGLSSDVDIIDERITILENNVGDVEEIGDADISISCGESNPFWVDGTMYIYDTRCSSDFISVKEGEIIEYILYGENTTRIMAFDSSKNALTEKASISTEDIGTYVVPSGVSFVKLYRLKESSGGQTGNKAYFVIKGLITDIAELKEEVSKRLLTVFGFSDFVKLGSGVWTISNDGVSATSSSTGLANAIKYPINAVECEDSFIISCRIMGTTSSFEGLIGKLDGTVAGILKDSNGSYAVLYGVDNGTMTQTHKVPLSFEINKDDVYSVSLEKKTTTVNYFILSITDKHGNIDTFEFGNGSTIEGDTYNDNSYNSIGAYGWGNPCCVVNSGTIEFSYYSIQFGSLVEQRLLIWGHSFIEGQSLPDQKEKRFSALMKTEIGDDRCIIWGKSGATTGLLRGWFNSMKNLIRDFKYIVFCIGTNDGYMNPTNPAESYYSVADQNTAAVNCQYLYDECLKLDIVPIFMLQTPLKTTGNIPSVLNAYMIAHFKYVVDPRGVFYNSDGTINQAVYNDDVHPNVLGHQKIFNLIKTQVANVF